MDSFNLSLDQLAKETFELGEQLSMQGLEKSEDFSFIDRSNCQKLQINSIWEDQDSEYPTEFEEENCLEVLNEDIEEDSLQTYPDQCGLIYKVEKTAGTFCVRAIVCQNLQNSYDLLKQGNSELLSSLKIEDFESEEIDFFETCSIERAEILCDHLANRRFPIDEDVMCNISDPGFSWWLSVGEGSFKIYFNSHGLNRADRFMRLGPLGDVKVAGLRFGQLESCIEKLFPLSEFSATEKSIYVSTAALDNQAYYKFQAIFTDGVNDLQLEDFNSAPNSKTLYLYLEELADLRSFWLIIEHKIYASDLIN